MKYLKLLHSNDFIMVDDDVYEWASKYTWHRSGREGLYPARSVGKRRKIYLHQEIMGCPGIDHINRNTLDNRRENLRIADQSTNRQNTVHTNGRVGYKGVSMDHGKYKAKIVKCYKEYYLGLFSDPIAAAKAYDEKALTLFGPLALTNKKLGKFRE